MFLVVSLWYMASAQRALPEPDTEPSRPSPRKQLRLVSRAKLIIDRVVEKPDIPVEWPSAIGYALAELTPKQRHFAVCVASGMRQAAAYRMAYDVAEDTSLNTLCSSSCMVAAHPNVAVAIELLLAWLDRQWLLESQEVLEYGYQRLYEEAENGPDSADRTRAAIALLKAHGAFVSRSEVRHIHQVDTSQTEALLSTITDLIGLAVPKPPSIPAPADVASVTFTDPD